MTHKKYVLLIFVVMSKVLLCMDAKTDLLVASDKTPLRISNNNNLQSIYEYELSRGITQAYCMAKYIRQQLNIGGDPTQAEVSFFERIHNTPEYQDVSQEVLQSATKEKKIFTKVMHFYAQKYEEERAGSHNELELKKSQLCYKKMRCCGLVSSVVCVIAMIFVAMAELPQCQ